MLKEKTLSANIPDNIHAEQDTHEKQPAHDPGRHVPKKSEVAELDLAELVAVLFRHKGFIIGMTILATLATIAYGMLITPRYRVMTMIRIGTYLFVDDNSNSKTSTEGAISIKNFENIEDDKSINLRIESIAKMVTEEMTTEEQKKGNQKGLGFSLKRNLIIRTGKDSDIATIEFEAPKDSMGVEFLEMVNRKLIEDHKTLLNLKQTEIKNDIERIKLAAKDFDIEAIPVLNAIEDLKRRYGNMRAEKKIMIADMDCQIRDIGYKKDAVKERIDLLLQEKNTIGERIKEVKNRYDKLTEAKYAADKQVKGPEAVAMILFNNEIQAIQTYLSDLIDRKTLTIPQTVGELNTQLHELESQIFRIQKNKELEEEKYALLDQEMNEKKQEIKGQLTRIENQKMGKQIDIKTLLFALEKMTGSQVKIPPRFSTKPIPKTQLIMFPAFGFAAGFFLAVFLAFVIEFWKKNRRKIINAERAA